LPVATPQFHLGRLISFSLLYGFLKVDYFIADAGRIFSKRITERTKTRPVGEKSGDWPKGKSARLSAPAA
jgi:hypothetical protein